MRRIIGCGETRAKKARPESSPNPYSPLLARDLTPMGQARGKCGKGPRKSAAVCRHGTPGVPPTGEGPYYCPVTIRTSPAAFRAPDSSSRHSLRVLPAVHTRPA
ncbi:hypothetical protein GCM10010372_10300 [Streptomyces tauricus]|nr:hypothetical protein GCM10010372_10300 [Streptomyces tauricus]